MISEERSKYQIDLEILNNYVDMINFTEVSMCELIRQLNHISSNKMKISNEQLNNIYKLIDIINEFITKNPGESSKIYFDVINQLMKANNDILLSRMLEPLRINRSYITILEKNKIIEKISRGIYISTSSFEDSYFSFQQKYKKAIFSHMNALYFHGMTEELPYVYTITVPYSYHTNNVNEKCRVFYVSDDIYELGITEVETPNGNKVKAYDKERCICDIIRSSGRMDMEQVYKSIKEYKNSSDKNYTRLSKYAKKMGICKKVMEMVGDKYNE